MNTKNIFRAALSMTAALMMTACSSDDINKVTPQGEGKIIPFEATVSSRSLTRATVDDDNKTLKFAAGDKLYITGENIKGVLEIASGTETASATFSGNLIYTGEGSPASDLALNATLVSAKQTDGKEVNVNEAGVVAVAYPTTAYCATVNEAVQKYSNLTGESTYGKRSFTLAQATAFLNFVITFEDDTDNGEELTAVVKNGETTLCTANVTTALESDKIVAKFVLPVAAGTALSSATVTMDEKSALAITDATLDGKVYNVNKTQAVSNVVDLSTVTTATTIKDGYTVTGTLGANVQISIADGATVTLDGVTITGKNSSDYQWAGITCEGDATITLEGTNTVKGFADGYPGIFVSSGKTLVINGTGELNASSNGSYNTGKGGAGIGGGNKMDCGNIEIQSGTVTATGNADGAGIGGGQNANCGNITISGGTVTATGGDRAAGIGGGRRGNSGTNGGYDSGSCGNITISGGTVTATGGDGAAGIGGGRGYNNSYKSSCGTITITSGVTSVTATKSGTDAPNSIGAGYSGTCGTVTIGCTLDTDGNPVSGTGTTGAISDSPYTYDPNAPAYTMAANATTGDVGKLICTDGHIHAYNADAACTKSRVAKIIYVGSSTGDATYNHGLALALTDESSSKDWDNAKTACTNKNTSATVESASWMLPSKTQWETMGATSSTYTTLRNGFTSVGGSNLQSNGYWSSTEDGSTAWQFLFGTGGWLKVPKGGENPVRACLAF